MRIAMTVSLCVAANASLAYDYRRVGVLEDCHVYEDCMMQDDVPCAENIPTGRVFFSSVDLAGTLKDQIWVEIAPADSSPTIARFMPAHLATPILDTTRLDNLDFDSAFRHLKGNSPYPAIAYVNGEYADASSLTLLFADTSPEAQIRYSVSRTKVACNYGSGQY